jgi:hypothetical protein
MKESLGSCREGTSEAPATAALLRRSTRRAEVTRIVIERPATGHPHENVPHLMPDRAPSNGIGTKEKTAKKKRPEALFWSMRLANRLAAGDP